MKNATRKISHMTFISTPNNWQFRLDKNRSFKPPFSQTAKDSFFNED